MKKTAALFLSCLFAALSISASAAQGDIAGEVYETDIKTYCFGKELHSYNIGGQTVIICEDMRGFGMDVVWNNDTRTLDVTDKYPVFVYEPNGIQRNIDEEYAALSQSSLRDARYIYESDITVSWNGMPIRAYALNGVMGVIAEDLINYGYNVEWSAEDRTLSISQNMTPSIETDAGTFYTDGKMEAEMSREKVWFYLGQFIKESGEELYMPCLIDTSKNGVSTMMVPAETACAFLGIDITVRENEIYFDSSRAVKPTAFKRLTYCYPDGMPAPLDDIGTFFEQTRCSKDIFYPYVKMYVNGTEIDDLYTDTVAKPNMHGGIEASIEKKPYIYNNTLYIPSELIIQKCFDNCSGKGDERL